MSEGDAVVLGMAQATKICEKIGMKLTRIVSVEEVTDFGEEEEEAENAEGQNNEED